MGEQNTEFEKFMSDKGYAVSYIGDGQYEFQSTQLNWQIWQAASAESKKRIAELEARHARDSEEYNAMRMVNIELQSNINILREALEMLVMTKDYKDSVGKDAVYESMRVKAWEYAERVLSATAPQCLQAFENEVLERAAKVCDEMDNEYGWVKVAANTIRLLKGKQNES